MSPIEHKIWETLDADWTTPKSIKEAFAHDWDNRPLQAILILALWRLSQWALVFSLCAIAIQWLSR